MTSARAHVRIFVAFVAAVVVSVLARAAEAGYTHYWRWRSAPEPTALRACLDEMGRIVDAERDELSDFEERSGSAAVFATSETFGDAGPTLPAIGFNGVGDDGYEAFGFPLAPFTADDPSFQFVKTAMRPYDEVVAACLIVARDHFSRDVLSIASDGTWEHEWKDGARLYERVLGRPAIDPLDEPDAVLPDAPAPALVEPIDPGERRRNLILSLVVFGAIVVAILIGRRRR